MLKHLLTALLILITLVVTTQDALAVTTPTTPQAPSFEKKYLGIWQKITLRNLLQQQSHETSTTVQQSSPTATPSPKISKTPTNRIKAPTPTKRPITPTPTKRSEVPTPTKKPIAPTPTKKPLPTATATKTPTPTITSVPTNDVTTFIMDEINAYRSSQGLSAVQINTETCNFANTRAQEISTNFSHDGFNERKNNDTLPYAHWTAITENIAMTSNYKDVVTMWKNSSGHAANMRANTPFVCVMQHGNYFAYEGMKP
jgi:uncharacterized protein YkwD